MGVKLRNSVSAALAAVKSDNLGTLRFFGSAGLLDKEEGTMGFLLDMKDKAVLVDCGPRVFDILHEMNAWNRIEAIVLVSATEASTGSLASVVRMIYETTGKQTPIICMDHVGTMIDTYLAHANAVPDPMFRIYNVSSNEGIKSVEGLPIHCAFRRTPKAGSMMLMEVLHANGPFFIFHSGYSLNTTVFDLLAEEDPQLLERMKNRTDDVIVLHDAVLTEAGHRCFCERLKPWSGVFKNFLLFGHSEKEGRGIIFRLPTMKSLSTSNASEFLIETNNPNK